MKIFNGSTECHTHLTDVHGGYYWYMIYIYLKVVLNMN